MDHPLLSMENIVKSFPGVMANRGIDLEVRPQEIHSLLGENGAGKSTLMKILSGAYSLDTGKIVLDGQDIDLAAYRTTDSLSY